MERLLLQRFFARQIDNIIINIIVYVLYNYSEINPLLIMMAVNLVYSLLEASCLFYFKTSIGKYFLGLSIKPMSFKDFLIRSLTINFLVQAMGISIIQIFNYSLILISKNFFWERNSIVYKEYPKQIRGYISLLMLGIFLSSIFFFDYVRNERESQVIKNEQEIIYTTEVYFPNFDSFNLELWMEHCVSGAKKGFDAYQKKPDFDYIVKTCRYESQKYSSKLQDNYDIIIYGCSLGLGLSMQIIFEENALDIINNEGEQLLKETCFPEDI